MSDQDSAINNPEPRLVCADDALKYAVALLNYRAEWINDSIGGSDCNTDHDVELDALTGIARQISTMAANFGDLQRYSDGRLIKSSREIQRGFITEHLWHPDPEVEAISSWRGFSRIPMSPALASLRFPRILRCRT